MKQNNLAKLLGIALVVAIIATGVFYGLFVNKLSSSTGSGKTVVVAAKPIPVGTVLAEPTFNRSPGRSTGPPPECSIRRSRSPDIRFSCRWPKASLCWPQGWLPQSNGSGGSGVPEGMRAVSVHVSDSSGVLAQLGPGQKVDVQVLITRKSANAEPELAPSSKAFPSSP